MSAYPIGSVLKLTRNDTDADIARNLEKMKAAGLNIVVIWPAAFWWEEKTADYPFRTGKFILETAEKIGIQVIMELAGQLQCMEYLPDSLMKPEYHVTKLDGGRERMQSSFGVLNYFHPEVRAIVKEHYRKAALAYKDYESLAGYDVFNETMYRSFDPWTMAEFQQWLQEKYGTIDRLNAVWERTYSDFSQIEYEDWKWMSIMPEADYCAFRKAAIPRFMKEFSAAVKEVDPKHFTVADNIHSMVQPDVDYVRPQDDYSLREFADQIGMSFYPKGVSGCMEPAKRWEIFDGYYDASGRNGFFISEMQTHVQALFNPTTCVEKYELKQWCMEAYAAGAKALIYWMWRPFDKGLQTLGRGLVNYKELPTERLELAGELSKIFNQYGAVKPARAKAAILFDPLCDDFQRRLTDSYKVEQNIYLKSIFGAYKALFDNRIPADIIRIDEISDYEAVILTNHIVLTEADAEKLKAYVEQGGKLFIDGKFGIVDETSQMHRTLPGGPANVLIGEEFFDTDNHDNTVILRDPLYKSGRKNAKNVLDRIPGFMGRDVMIPAEETEILASFPDGKPAAVRKTTGSGSVTMINTSVFYGYACGNEAELKMLIGCEADRLGLKLIDTETPLYIRLAEADEKKLLFAFNYTDAPVETMLKLMQNGRPYMMNLKVGAQDVQILELP